MIELMVIEMLCDTFKERYDGMPIAVYARDWIQPLATAQETFCHHHREIEMVCVLEGCAKVHIGRETYTVQKGNTFFVSPYVLHYTEVAKGDVYVNRCVCFDATLLQDTALSKALEDGAAVLSAVSSDEKMFMAIQRIYEACTGHTDSWRMEAQGWLLLLFSYLQKSGCVKRKPLPQDDVFCRKVLSFLSERYGEGITSADVAAFLFLSQGHFCRQFKLHFNDTFSNYLRRFRLEKARELLYETNLPITAVAHMVGFDDPSYFAKCFRELFGITPGASKKRGSLFAYTL